MHFIMCLFPQHLTLRPVVFIVIPKKDAIHPDISVEDGLKAIISGGILDPGNSLSGKLPPQS